MAMRNPKGRANYEPNSWGGEAGGPRESPGTGFRSFPAEEAGRKERIRSETFADHYSQARQFYISRPAVEQAHIVAALVFELSKVETPRIRVRVVSHLRNIDEDLARKVADGKGLAEMPAPAEAAMPTRMDIRGHGAQHIPSQPNTFEGRKLGVLLTDGADAQLVAALRSAVKRPVRRSNSSRGSAASLPTMAASSRSSSAGRGAVGAVRRGRAGRVGRGRYDRRPIPRPGTSLPTRSPT